MAASVAERSSNIPKYLGSEQKQVSDYTLSRLIATEREKQREETESLSLLAFESNENVISKILKSSVIQDGFSKAFVTVRSSLSIPNTQGDTLSFPSILFLSHSLQTSATPLKCFGERGSSGLAALAALGSSQAFLCP